MVSEVTKYQSSPYLDEVEAVKAEVRNAAGSGRKPNLKDFHPLAIEAVDVNLLTAKQVTQLNKTRVHENKIKRDK